MQNPLPGFPLRTGGPRPGANQERPCMLKFDGSTASHAAIDYLVSFLVGKAIWDRMFKCYLPTKAQGGKGLKGMPSSDAGRSAALAESGLASTRSAGDWMNEQASADPKIGVSLDASWRRMRSCACAPTFDVVCQLTQSRLALHILTRLCGASLGSSPCHSILRRLPSLIHDSNARHRI